MGLIKAKESRRKVGRKILEWMDDSDEVDSEFLWQDFMADLDAILKKKNSDGYWFAEVSNFGWRNLNGSKHFAADNGETFLQKILPKTDCHFKIFNFGNGLAIQNFHHDSPVGNEWYYVVPVSYSTYSKLSGG